MKEREKMRKKGYGCIRVMVGVLLVMAVFLAGCHIYETPEEKMGRMLKEEYGEKFTVYNAYYDGAWIEGVVAPVNDPTLIFKQEIDTREYSKSFGNCYRHAYGSRLVMQMMEDDIEQLFPDSYFYTNYHFNPINDTIDFRGQTIEEFMANSYWDDETGKSENENGEKPLIPDGMLIFIVFSENGGTEEKYKMEYEFFSKKVEEYIKKGLMPHIHVILSKTSQESVEALKEYMEKNVEGDFFWDTQDAASELSARFYDFEGQKKKYEHITEEEYIKGRKEQ